MTVTPKSHEVEIGDLQRLLLSLGLMKFTDTTRGGHWGPETQAGVVALYAELGWDHAPDAQWVTAPAMAAITGRRSAHDLTQGRAGGGGSHAGGGGSHAGGGGSHAGGGGSHAG